MDRCWVEGYFISVDEKRVLFGVSFQSLGVNLFPSVFLVLWLVLRHDISLGFVSSIHSSFLHSFLFLFIRVGPY